MLKAQSLTLGHFKEQLSKRETTGKHPCGFPAPESVCSEPRARVTSQPPDLQGPGGRATWGFALSPFLRLPHPLPLLEIAQGWAGFL